MARFGKDPAQPPQWTNVVKSRRNRYLDFQGAFTRLLLSRHMFCVSRWVPCGMSVRVRTMLVWATAFLGPIPTDLIWSSWLPLLICSWAEEQARITMVLIHESTGGWLTLMRNYVGCCVDLGLQVLGSCTWRILGNAWGCSVNTNKSISTPTWWRIVARNLLRLRLNYEHCAKGHSDMDCLKQCRKWMLFWEDFVWASVSRSHL